jgi:hypothetical protein
MVSVVLKQRAVSVKVGLDVPIVGILPEPVRKRFL